MQHFHSFTADGMQRLGQDLAACREQRAESNRQTRASMLSALADFRKRHSEEAAQRRKRAEQEADERRLFMSELKSGVHAFMNRCGLSRGEMAADLRAMAGELAAAQKAWRDRSH